MLRSVMTHWVLALVMLAVGIYIGRKTGFLSSLPVIGS